MIEAYLRANKMFVDYSEVSDHDFLSIPFICKLLKLAFSVSHSY